MDLCDWKWLHWSNLNSFLAIAEQNSLVIKEWMNEWMNKGSIHSHLKIKNTQKKKMREAVFAMVKITLLKSSSQFWKFFCVKSWNNGGELPFQNSLMVNVEDSNVWKR